MKNHEPREWRMLHSWWRANGLLFKLDMDWFSWKMVMAPRDIAIQSPLRMRTRRETIEKPTLVINWTVPSVPL